MTHTDATTTRTGRAPRHYARPAAEIAALPDHAALRYSEAAEVLGCSYDFLKRIVARKSIASVRLGSHRRIPVWACREYIQAHTDRARRPAKIAP
ncbi:MAG: excisionase family DNA-binding protein [Gammaproteobacteria bacterium]